jgi:hydrogenase maturation protease
MTPSRLLVLGVGNVYYGDEGAGIHLIHYLRSRYRFPDGVDVIDGGTLGWHLLGMIASYQQVILIDAVAAPVGRIYAFTRTEIPPEIGYGRLSSHEWEVPDLLTAMELSGDLPDVRIVAIGVDPLTFGVGEVGVVLSDVVRGRLGALADVALRELARCGVIPTVARPDFGFDRPYGAEEIVLAHA